MGAEPSVLFLVMPTPPLPLSPPTSSCDTTVRSHLFKKEALRPIASPGAFCPIPSSWKLRTVEEAERNPQLPSCYGNPKCSGVCAAAEGGSRTPYTESHSIPPPPKTGRGQGNGESDKRSSASVAGTQLSQFLICVLSVLSL